MVEKLQLKMENNLIECLTLEKVDTNVNKNGERIQKKKEGEN